MIKYTIDSSGEVYTHFPGDKLSQTVQCLCLCLVNKLTNQRISRYLTSVIIHPTGDNVATSSGLSNS